MASWVGTLLLFASCQKNTDGNQSKATISLSSTQVAINQSLFATATVGGGGGGAQPVIRWSIQPATNNWLSAGGKPLRDAVFSKRIIYGHRKLFH